ncbi:hypothetical protein VNO77_03701 [Canavalia gladiata]|uniref:Uncharacterized protein n=1 Tax=Canavalia gladiata TaxID=3824 RepID=A0AAN9MV54_CANGL
MAASSLEGMHEELLAFWNFRACRVYTLFMHNYVLVRPIYGPYDPSSLTPIVRPFRAHKRASLNLDALFILSFRLNAAPTWHTRAMPTPHTKGVSKDNIYLTITLPEKKTQAADSEHILCAQRLYLDSYESRLVIHDSHSSSFVSRLCLLYGNDHDETGWCLIFKVIRWDRGSLELSFRDVTPTPKIYVHMPPRGALIYDLGERREWLMLLITIPTDSFLHSVLGPERHSRCTKDIRIQIYKNYNVMARILAFANFLFFYVSHRMHNT